FIDKIERISIDARKSKEERPVGLVLNDLSNIFLESKLPKEYKIEEYGTSIIEPSLKNAPICHAVQKVLYIDSPMLIGIETDVDYWEDVNNIIKREKRANFDTKIDEHIRTEILKGEVSVEQGDLFDEKFIYTKENGEVFNLLDCATGVKSFSILQLMLRNGFITKETLLIIDEPEAHLHPQWIVEYARLLVLMNKHIGVKFFIASHSPDMVSAIKYISQKEEISEALNFYLAREADNDKFIYESLGVNIEPVFESFNVALDRIDQYGVSDEEEEAYENNDQQL
ncbi:MAG: AAA family ATPase, partial [Bacteroidales bacterium]